MKNKANSLDKNEKVAKDYKNEFYYYNSDI
jgi:hypothetical protein